MQNDFFFLQNFVDNMFKTQSQIDHELISNKFMKILKEEFSNDRFEKLLICSGYIPDLYANDSSEETLSTKLVEGLVCEWARRMGYSSELIKQKSSMEDIKIIIDDRVVVCDAKSFRLGRSQQAPNAKDFLKLEDIRKWMVRYKNSIGGLVTYPCTHEWKSSSDIYQYCSTKDAPTLMLPYKYLAFILHQKDNFETHDLIKLWDYNKIFPDKLPKDMNGGNKAAYWQKINTALLDITQTKPTDFEKYLSEADILIEKCIRANLEIIVGLRSAIIKQIEDNISKENDIAKLKAVITEYQIKTETDLLDKLITRINDFRL